MILSFSEFLNKTFYDFDYAILNGINLFARFTYGIFTPLFKFITFITEKGLIFIIFAIFLMLFRRTRKVGICIFGAIGLGTIITNFVLKDTVARLRPYETNEAFLTMWNYVGAKVEEGFSFPSGHTTATMAAMMSIFLFTKSKKRYWLFLVVLLVGLSRNYLLAHYPTDVIAAIIIGLFASIVAYYITLLIYKILDKYDNKLFRFIRDFNLLKKKNDGSKSLYEK